MANRDASRSDNKTILLTGGAGFIGSHTAVVLLDRGYDVVLLDNFSNSKRDVPARIEKITDRSCICEEVDLTDEAAVATVFNKYDFDAVIHFAGIKSVGESVEKPLEYYDNNLTGTINLLKAMNASDVKNLIFSSSATVYRQDNPVPYYENYPLGATNPYGWTKVIIERILTDMGAVDHAWRVIMLRYFNPIGAHESGLIGEEPQGIPNNLLPYVAKVAAGDLPEIRIFGDDYDTPDGSGVRDYIHVMDLAEGHLVAMEYLRRMIDRDNKKEITEKDACSVASLTENSSATDEKERRLKDLNVRAFNIGTGKGTSVKEIIAAFERACGKELSKAAYPRRPGDLATVYADTSLAEKELGFKARRGIDEMCIDSWRWQQTAR
ncbi:MAG: UDP-glucose 4-epimerase GalE [Clostridiales Family XIII bacterium]|jgi:UDP-glucose 4-epimerase|nr:UDP-glucose 4-epimerase GalE [Clostridiales Family XIII bacterium]